MKRFFLTAAVVFSSLFTAQAQEGISENAIGMRFSDGSFFGAEINYQRLLDSNNRLELGLGFRNTKYINAYKITGVYQWLWNIKDGLHWYAGVGGALGTWRFDHPVRDDNGAIVAVTGQIGVEYNFDFPLQVFVDFRPNIYLTDYHDYNNFDPDFGIGARFKF